MWAWLLALSICAMVLAITTLRNARRIEVQERVIMKHYNEILKLQHRTRILESQRNTGHF